MVTQALFRVKKYFLFLMIFFNQLLKSNLCAFSFKLSLDIVSLFLGSALFKYLGSGINKILCFLEAKSRSFTYDFDDLNLVGTYLGKLYVELGLLFCCCACVTACRCRNYYACCRRYAKFLFTSLNKIVKLKYG